MSCSLLTSVGAYLLGALDPPDRVEFEAHIAHCPTCRGELLRLSPLPGLLHRVDPGDFAVPGDLAPACLASTPVAPAGQDPPPADPPTDPLPAAAARTMARRMRRHVMVVAAAAAVVTLCLGGVAAYALLRPPEPAVSSVSWSATDTASGVRADIDLIDRPWGTEVRVRLHDVPPGKPCKLVVRTRDGAREVAGWWATSYVEGEQVPGSTSFDLSRIAEVEVVTDDDKVLVDIPAPA